MGIPPLPRRVLMTADAVGGVWTYALELARGLDGNGIEVMLAVMGPPPSAAQRAEAAAIPRLILAESAFRLEWMVDAGPDVERAGGWLLGLERHFRPDIVHVNGYAHAALPWRAPCLLVAHSCVLSWWRAVKGCEAPAEWREYRDSVACGLALAGAVVAPTAAFLDEVESLYGSATEGHVIWNGRDPTRFPPTAKEELIVSAGRLWDEAKNIAALDRVAPRLPWPVAVAGDSAGPTRRAAPANLTCLGRLDEAGLAKLLGGAAIFALPARYEPFGLSVLEAALAGCALVLGNIPTLRELWNGAALFVPPGDDEALTLVLENLAANPGRRAALAHAARQRALSYSAARSSARYCALYARLMMQGRAPAGRPRDWRAGGLHP